MNYIKSKKEILIDLINSRKTIIIDLESGRKWNLKQKLLYPEKSEIESAIHKINADVKMHTEAMEIMYESLAEEIKISKKPKKIKKEKTYES